MKRFRWTALVGTAVVCAGALVGGYASAAPVLITKDFGGGPPPPNDCSGLFGTGNDCDVGGALNPPATISPIIAKFNVQDDGGFEKQLFSFDTIDGNEFSIFFDPDTDASGSWTYTKGEGDPDVRYWVAKGGNEGFKLHWYIDDANLSACDGETYTLACLQAAVVATTGTWSTLGQGLSHLSWYDTKANGNGNGGGGGGSAPEPATVGLIGLGMLALGALRRRKAVARD